MKREGSFKVSDVLALPAMYVFSLSLSNTEEFNYEASGSEIYYRQRFKSNIRRSESSDT